MPDSVLVTYAADAEEREAIERVVGAAAEVRYLKDETYSRDLALAETTAILAGNLRNELGVGDIDRMTNLRFVQILPAGANRIPFGDIPENVVIASNVGAYAEPMAEHALAMILALAKHLVPQNESLRQGRWDRSVDSRMLRGLTAGIVGYGGIGKATAELLRAFNMMIMAINSSGRSDDDLVFVGALGDLETVFRKSDLVVIALPLTKHTDGLIGARELSWMKPDGFLINVARGALIDEAALYEHAAANPLCGIGLDVWWGEPFTEGKFATRYPLLDLPNVIGSPHNSGHVPGMGVTGTTRAAENLRQFLTGGKVTGVVDRSQYV